MTTRHFIICFISQIALLILFFFSMFYIRARAATNEQAAYIEGRFGVDHATALKFVKSRP